MQCPLVVAARRRRSDAGGLTLFDCIDKIVPSLEFRWVHSGFLAQLLIVPKNDRCDVVRQAVNLASHREVLNGGGIKGILKATLGDLLGNLLTNARTDLFVHYAAAPAMKRAG